MHRAVLDQLGIQSIQVAIGGSMGGMQVLEWAALYGPQYVRHIIPIATAAHHSAWCLGWSELQRQSIQNDPLFNVSRIIPFELY
jgi:homoserine O-acetyltransferase